MRVDKWKESSKAYMGVNYELILSQSIYQTIVISNNQMDGGNDKIIHSVESFEKI